MQEYGKDFKWGFILETYGFTGYSTSNKGTCETIMESSTSNELIVHEDENEEKDDKDIFVVHIQLAVLSLIGALTAIRKPDCYLKSSNNNQEVLHLQKKFSNMC